MRVRDKVSLGLMGFTGFLIVPAAVTGAKTMAVILILFIVQVFWIMSKAMGGDILALFIQSTQEEAITAFKGKRYVKAAFYSIVAPMVIVGLITVGLILGYLFLK